MTLTSSYTASTDPAFCNRVMVAMVSAGISIQSEAASTPNHALRANYARSVLNQPSQFCPAFALALASQGLDNTSTDAAINSGVSSVWNALAGTV